MFRKANNTAIKLFYFPLLSTDIRFRWRTSSSQHTDKHPQFPSQPSADTEPYYASVWSHGHRTEWVQSPSTFPFFFSQCQRALTGTSLHLSRFKHIPVSDGASDQQCGGQPCSAAAGAVLPAASQPSPTEPDAAVSQPHEPAAIHGCSHTFTQSVTHF